MWTVLDRPGNSGAPERIALMERYIARFGEGSVGLLLADREFIGTDWSDWLIGNDIPFAIRLRGTHRATTAEGRNGTLERLVAGPGGAGAPPSLSTPWPRMARPDPNSTSARSGRADGNRSSSRPTVPTSTRSPPAANAFAIVLGPMARQRLIIECLFADAKRRGLNFEDTRLTCPRKLAPLTAIVAIAIAWAGAAATDMLGRRAPPRKAHGYLAKSIFRIGFEPLRTLLRADPLRTLEPWKNLAPTIKAAES